jgi:predicted transcriptional regulator
MDVAGTTKKRMGRPPGPMKKPIGFKLPPELCQRIREAAAALGQQNSALVETAVQNWISTQRTLPPPLPLQDDLRARRRGGRPPGATKTQKPAQGLERAEKSEPALPKDRMCSPELTEKIRHLARNLGSEPEKLVEPVLENWVRKVLITGRLGP